MFRITLFLSSFILLTSLFLGCSNPNLDPGVYASIETTRGSILVQINYKEAPIASLNFLGLALGKLDIKMQEQAESGDLEEKIERFPFYDDSYFTVAEEGFIIQGGDPIGDGSGSPGYIFDDEIIKDSFNIEGILAMANDGPNTNGSQFFITLGSFPDLNNRYTAFGRLVSGLDVAKNIQVGDQVFSIDVIKKGVEAKNFDISQKHFDTLQEALVEERAQKNKQIKADLLEEYSDLEENRSGILYRLLYEGIGDKIDIGDNLEIHYTISLLDGTLIESTENNDAPLFNGSEPLLFLVGNQKVPPGFNSLVQDLRVGDSVEAFLPPNMGFNQRAYTSNQLRIPSYSWLKLELRTLDSR